MEGLYIGAMGMLSSQNYINSTANNITNVNTAGYKFDTMVSDVYENNQIYRQTPEERVYIGDSLDKVVENGTVINLKPGIIQMTNNPLDVALNDGDSGQTSFFVVSSDGNSYLTRSGNFETNEDGELKTLSGAFVLDVNNRHITIPPKQEVNINKEGQVVNSQTGEIYATIQIKSIGEQTKNLLEKAPSAMFHYAGNIGSLPNSKAMVESGALEASNVDLTNEMTELLTSQRRFQANSKAFMSYDKILDKEANQLIK